MKKILAVRHFSEKLVSETAAGKIFLHVWRKNVDHLLGLEAMYDPEKNHTTSEERKKFNFVLPLREIFLYPHSIFKTYLRPC